MGVMASHVGGFMKFCGLEEPHCQPHKISGEHRLFEEGPCMSVKVQFSDVCCLGILNLGNDVIYLCTSLIIISLLDWCII